MSPCAGLLLLTCTKSICYPLSLEVFVDVHEIEIGAVLQRTVTNNFVIRCSNDKILFFYISNPSVFILHTRNPRFELRRSIVVLTNSNNGFRKKRYSALFPQGIFNDGCVNRFTPGLDHKILQFPFSLQCLKNVYLHHGVIDGSFPIEPFHT